MTVQRTSRTGNTYYLHAKISAAGKPNYFFSTVLKGQLAPSIPDGYEICENAGGQVFLRKKTTPIIRPQELAVVEAALRRGSEAWRYWVEVKKNAIVVYEAGDMQGLDTMLRELGRPVLSNDDKRRHAAFTAVLRFTLVDKKTRDFATERFCFRGSVDDWIPLGGSGTLTAQVRQFVKHLGRESFYELF